MQVSAENKTCARCLQPKARSDFSPDKQALDGLKSHCKTCRSAAKRDYYTRNRAKVVASQAAYHAANRARLLQARRDAYRPGAETTRAALSLVYALDPVKQAAAHIRVRAWRKANPDKRAAQARRRRAAFFGAEVEAFTPAAVFLRDNFTCYLCGLPTLGLDPTTRNAELAPSLDHLVPLSRGGGHTLSNVACAHRACNTQRGVKPWAACAAFMR